MDQNELIRRSLRCFTFGLLGLFPLLGLPVAGLALGEFIRTERQAAAQWNPAQNYLHCGVAFACVSMTLPVVVLQTLVMFPLSEMLLSSLGS